jgi:hypothetical protein
VVDNETSQPPLNKHNGKGRFQRNWNKRNKSKTAQSEPIGSKPLSQATQNQSNHTQLSQNQVKRDNPKRGHRRRGKMAAPAVATTDNKSQNVPKQTAAEYIPPHLRKRPNNPKGDSSKPLNGASHANPSTKALPAPQHPANGYKSANPPAPYPPSGVPRPAAVTAGVTAGGVANKSSKKPIDKAPAAPKKSDGLADHWPDIVNNEEPNWANSTVYRPHPKTAVQPKALPSPPYSPPTQDQTHQQQNGHWRGRNPPRGPKQPHQKTIWPKNRDMKAQPVDDDESDGGVPCEKSGTGTEYDVRQLMDWNGGWLPASVEWAARKPFMHNNLTTHIDQWAEKVWQAYNPKNENGTFTYHHGFVPISSPPYTEPGCKKGEEAWTKGGDIALQQWIPIQIDGESPQQFWRSYPAQAPPPQSDIDLTESRPWWEEFTGQDHCQLPKLNVPNSPLDPSEADNRLPGRSMTANEAIRRKAYAEKKKHDRQMEKRHGALNQTPPELVMPDTTLKPTANIYLRPVVAATDSLPITKLYNHYVRNCISTPEFVDRTEAQMYRRIMDVVNRGLPWIVAVQKGKGKWKGNQKATFGTENIVGFANLEGE